MDWDDADDYASRREPRRGGRGRGSDITQALREAQQLQQDGQIARLAGAILSRLPLPVFELVTPLLMRQVG